METEHKELTIVEKLKKRNEYIKNPESLIDDILKDGRGLKMDYKIVNWWDNLSEKEKNLLIELLWNLDLEDYIKTDKEGKYIKLK